MNRHYVAKDKEKENVGGDDVAPSRPYQHHRD
jgi:hypothetical protein